MDRTNFSLLSALYGNETRNLYNEIYFPIIRYSLFYQMKDSVSSDGFSTAESLKELIRDKFDISIPVSILKGAIRKIDETDNDIDVYEKGNSFKITQRWTDSAQESISVIDRKAAVINEKMSELEQKFQTFIKEEDIKGDYTFSEFFSNHTSELLVFLNGENHDLSQEDSNTASDAKYANLMQFVKILRETDLELYEVAETFFWSSVVAAFLQRNQSILKGGQDTVRYYLDTSLVMALLDLAEPERVNHARDLKEMIENAGYVVCVHPMTLREIDTILQSASKTGGPEMNSGIFEAYHRRGLTPADLLKIASNMRRDLEKQQVAIYRYSEQALDKDEKAYMSNKDVMKLGKLRVTNKPYRIEFREIHDIYMRDFIEKERKAHFSLPSKGKKEMIYFLTMNQQLITFSRQKIDGANEPLMIHPGSVIANLWINGALSKGLGRSGLSEMISRCLSANHVDARSRMTVLAKYSDSYIEDPDQRKDFCRKAYKQIVKQSNKITPLVDEAIASWSENRDDDSKQDSLRETMVVLVKTVKEEDERTNGQMFKLTEKIASLEANYNQRESIQNEKIKILEDENTKKDRLLAAFSEKDKTRDKREQLNSRKIKLHERLDELRNEFETQSNYFRALETACEKSITDNRYYMELGLGIGIIFAILIVIYLNVRNTGLMTAWEGAGLGGITLIVGMTTLWKLFIPSSGKKEKYRNKQRNNWMTAHPEYNKTSESINRLKQEKAEIKKELSQLKHQLSDMTDSKFS